MQALQVPKNLDNFQPHSLALWQMGQKWQFLILEKIHLQETKLKTHCPSSLGYHYSITIPLKKLMLKTAFDKRHYSQSVIHKLNNGRIQSSLTSSTNIRS